jgi:hypothetical protein
VSGRSPCEFVDTVCEGFGDGVAPVDDDPVSVLPKVDGGQVRPGAVAVPVVGAVDVDVIVCEDVPENVGVGKGVVTVSGGPVVIPGGATVVTVWVAVTTVVVAGLVAVVELVVTVSVETVVGTVCVDVETVDVVPPSVG